VLFLRHTTTLRLPEFGGGEAPTKPKVLSISYTCFLDMYIFFNFLYILTDLYSNKTGYDFYIAAHHFCSKFLFYKEKY
jgi:hypothetical protein